MHLIRCSPSFDHPSLLSFDNLLRDGLVNILNCDLTDSQWMQACLPVKDGGLGVRSVAALAPSAYLASAASTASLQDLILTPGDRLKINDEYLDAAVAVWSAQSGKPVLELADSLKQSAWDRPVIEAYKAALWNSFTNDSRFSNT